MSSTAQPHDAEARFDTVDAALRWLVRTRPGPRSLDLAGVSIGWEAARYSLDETLPMRSAILATLQHLDERELAALGMRAVGHSWPEIGRELGVSVATARRRVLRGREKLAKRLRALGLLERNAA